MSKFNDIINAEQPVLVDFFAEWCAPCKAMNPVLKEVVSQLKGKARIIKVDVDKNPAVASKYNVSGVPTLVLFKKGEIKWRQAGTLKQNQLLEIIQKFT